MTEFDTNKHDKELLEKFFDDKFNFLNTKVQEEAFDDDGSVEVILSCTICRVVETKSFQINPLSDIVRLYYADMVDNYSARDAFGDFK